MHREEEEWAKGDGWCGAGDGDAWEGLRLTCAWLSLTQGK